MSSWKTYFGFVSCGIAMYVAFSIGILFPEENQRKAADEISQRYRHVIKHAKLMIPERPDDPGRSLGGEDFIVAMEGQFKYMTVAEVHIPLWRNRLEIALASRGLRLWSPMELNMLGVPVDTTFVGVKDQTNVVLRASFRNIMPSDGMEFILEAQTNDRTFEESAMEVLFIGKLSNHKYKMLETSPVVVMCLNYIKYQVMRWFFLTSEETVKARELFLRPFSYRP